ncbi:MAG TPA: outer membrane beta-barrel protein [Terriglobia bacterium]|nr:outer membrane beta-barrel protein [Terriglobia bacterium]
MKNLRCFLVLMCVLAAVPAYADGDLTLFGAIQHQGKLTLQSAQTAATTTSNFNPGTFGAFGLRFSHGKVFGGEHTIAYAPNFLTSQSKAIIYNSDILVQAPLPKIKPYGTAGLGTVFSWGTTSNGQPAFSKIGTKFALNYGGGVKIFPAGPVGVRFDIRGYAIPDAKFNLPSLTSIATGQTTATVQSQGKTLNMLEVGLGVVFKF